MVSGTKLSSSLGPVCEEAYDLATALGTVQRGGPLRRWSSAEYTGSWCRKEHWEMQLKKYEDPGPWKGLKCSELTDNEIPE